MLIVLVCFVILDDFCQLVLLKLKALIINTMFLFSAYFNTFAYVSCQ